MRLRIYPFELLQVLRLLCIVKHFVLFDQSFSLSVLSVYQIGHLILETGFNLGNVVI